jgi:plasmid stabilization system protein ParE
VKAEARRKREEILEFLRKNPWRNPDGTQKCIRAVTKAIKRLCGHLARAVDAAGKPHPVLQDFARHLREHLLIPSGRDGGHGGARAMTAFGGCFTYEPPLGVVWRRIED